ARPAGARRTGTGRRFTVRTVRTVRRVEFSESAPDANPAGARPPPARAPPPFRRGAGAAGRGGRGTALLFRGPRAWGRLQGVTQRPGRSARVDALGAGQSVKSIRSDTVDCRGWLPGREGEPMSRQTEANRANALLSTGPQSAEGKA